MRKSMRQRITRLNSMEQCYCGRELNEHGLCPPCNQPPMKCTCKTETFSDIRQAPRGEHGA